MVVGPPGTHVEPPSDYDSASRTALGAVYPMFFHGMLERGVFVAPGPYEVLFPGLAHDDAVLDRVVDAAGVVAADVATRVGGAG